MNAQPPTPGAEPQIELLDADIQRIDAPEDGEPSLVGVNWTVRAGDFWVVAAPPGTGRTDLLTTAAGLLPPVRGELLLFGFPTGGASDTDMKRLRMRIGLVLEQGGRVFNEMTVADNITLPVCYHKNCRPQELEAQANALLAMTGLEAFATESPDRLARSLKPRIALARALALNPEALLLDNPLAGLDLRQSRWWVSLLCELSKGHAAREQRPLTIVVTTDDLRPWLECSHQFALLKRNRWTEFRERPSVDNTSDPEVLEMLGAPVYD